MIKKRYSDFVKFRQILIKVFYYKIIPVLPPKNLLSKIKKQKDIYKERAKGLKRFLTQIIADKEIFALKVVKHFFLDEHKFNLYYEVYFGSETHLDKFYKKNSQFFSSTFQAFKNLTGLSKKQKFQLEAKDVKFVQMHREIEHLKSFLGNNLENVVSLKQGFNSLKSSYNDVLSMLKEDEFEEDLDQEHDLFRESVFTQFDTNQLMNSQEDHSGLKGECL